jgi:hypothetical protein
MALYLKYFRKSKNTLKWFVFSCVPSQMRTLIIWRKKNRKAWKEMTKMLRTFFVILGLCFTTWFRTSYIMWILRKIKNPYITQIYFSVFIHLQLIGTWSFSWSSGIIRDFLKYWTVFLCWFRRIKNVGHVCTHFITSAFIFSHGCCWSSYVA